MARVIIIARLQNLLFLELLFTTIQSNSNHINSKSDNKRHHKDRTRGSVKKGP